MKKHDEGYVMAFVMVVIVVLCLVAVSLMSISLRNLEAQNASIQRMEDKYAAMGEIEKVVAVIDSELVLEKNVSLEESLVSFWQGSAEISNVRISGVTEENAPITGFTATVKIARQCDSVRIETTISWEASVDSESSQYKITTTQLTYTSYQISTVETGEGGA